MDHLAIPVTDQEASRRFYERCLGFGARPSRRVEWWEEPEYVSVKCRDPDGYIVEAAWEPGS